MGNCSQVLNAVAALYAVAVSSTSLLFLIRIHAICKGNTCIVCFFVVIWLVVTGGCIAAATGVSASAIGPTKYCLDTGLKPYVAAAIIVPLVNDTLIFLTIGLQLVSSSNLEERSMKKILRVLFGKDDLPTRLAQVLLKDGQLYYLYVIGV